MCSLAKQGDNNICLFVCQSVTVRSHSYFQSGVFVCMSVINDICRLSGLAVNQLLRGPNLFFKYFYFLFGPGLFYLLRMIATVQIFFGTLVGPLTLLHPKMKLLPCREPREPETLVFLHFTWFYDYEIRVQSTSHFPH